MYKLIVGIAFGLLLFNGTAMATCSSYPYTLTNGATADATQVMADFNCAALTSGAVTNNMMIGGITNTPNSGLFNQDATLSLYASNNYVYLNGVSTGYGLALQGGGNQKQQILINGSLSGPIDVWVSGSQSARFASDGSFLVGTTNNGGWSGGAKAEAVSALAYGTAMSAYITASGGQAYLARVDSTSTNLMSFYYGPSTNLSYWSTNGSTSTFNNPSDARFKNINVKQFDYSQAIRNMWVGDYEWKRDGAHDFGGVAQQAYKALSGSPIRDVFVKKPANDKDKWFIASDYYGRFALWGVKDLYSRTDGQRIAISGVQTNENSLRAEINALIATNDNEVLEIRQLKYQVAALSREIHIRTAQR